MPILLDTHAAVWSVSGKLSKALAQRIDDAAMHNELLLSPLSAWEIGMLVRKRRLTLNEPAADYIRDLYALPGVITAPLTPAIALAAAVLDASVLDPVDRMIVATAQHFSAKLVTRDAAILAFGKQSGGLRCIRC